MKRCTLWTGRCLREDAMETGLSKTDSLLCTRLAEVISSSQSFSLSPCGFVLVVFWLSSNTQQSACDEQQALQQNVTELLSSCSFLCSAFPGSSKRRRKEELLGKPFRRPQHELDPNGLVPLPVKVCFCCNRFDTNFCWPQWRHRLLGFTVCFQPEQLKAACVCSSFIKTGLWPPCFTILSQLFCFSQDRASLNTDEMR